MSFHLGLFFLKLSKLLANFFYYPQLITLPNMLSAQANEASQMELVVKSTPANAGHVRCGFDP